MCADSVHELDTLPEDQAALARALREALTGTELEHVVDRWLTSTLHLVAGLANVLPPAQSKTLLAAISQRAFTVRFRFAVVDGATVLHADVKAHPEAQDATVTLMRDVMVRHGGPLQ